MNDVTDQEIADARAAFSVWRSPADFQKVVHEFDLKVRSASLFNRSKLGFVRDALTVVEFLPMRDALAVRLSTEAERWPDGFIETAGGIERLEVTEVLEPGRRRGDEYKGGDYAAEDDPIEDWVKRAEMAPLALERAIKDKAEKRYSDPFTLLVYLNINDVGVRHNEVRLAISQIRQQHQDAFEDLCVFWKGKWY